LGLCGDGASATLVVLAGGIGVGAGVDAEVSAGSTEEALGARWSSSDVGVARLRLVSGEEAVVVVGCPGCA
jgi:hypothetical protein